MERHLYHYDTIDASLEAVLAIVHAHPADVLGPNIGRAADGDDPVHRLHAHFAGSDVSKAIVITHEELEEYAPGTHRLRVAWHATDHEDWYPVMVGELEFSGLATRPPRCEVAFIGHYKPPLGFVGAIADRLVGHRIATEAVAGFVKDVCARISRAIANQAASDAA